MRRDPMTTMQTKLIAIIGLIFVLGLAGKAYPVAFSDGTFNLSGYTPPIAFNSDPAHASVTLQQCASCGNPGQALQHSVTSTVTSFATNDTLTNLSFNYNPSVLGAITGIDAAADILLSLPPGFNVTINGFVPVLLQNGTYYADFLTAANIANTFITVSRTGLHASDFSSFAPTSNFFGGNFFGTGHPDFSSSGGPIQFGVLTAASCTGAACVGSGTVAYVVDNLAYNISSAGVPA